MNSENVYLCKKKKEVWKASHHLSFTFQRSTRGQKTNTTFDAIHQLSMFQPTCGSRGPPRFFSKSCSFEASERGNPHFEQILDSAPPSGVKTPLGHPDQNPGSAPGSPRTSWNATFWRYSGTCLIRSSNLTWPKAVDKEIQLEIFAIFSIIFSQFSWFRRLGSFEWGIMQQVFCVIKKSWLSPKNCAISFALWTMMKDLILNFPLDIWKDLIWQIRFMYCAQFAKGTGGQVDVMSNKAVYFHRLWLQKIVPVYSAPKKPIIVCFHTSACCVGFGWTSHVVLAALANVRCFCTAEIGQRTKNDWDC